jgi:hypothetical protein
MGGSARPTDGPPEPPDEPWASELAGLREECARIAAENRRLRRYLNEQPHRLIDRGLRQLAGLAPPLFAAAAAGALLALALSAHFMLDRTLNSFWRQVAPAVVAPLVTGTGPAPPPIPEPRPARATPVVSTVPAPMITVSDPRASATPSASASPGATSAGHSTPVPPPSIPLPTLPPRQTTT